jgi:hypothetical protein
MVVIGGTLVATPASGTGSLSNPVAQETRYDTINLVAGVNSVAAEQVGAALRSWQFSIGNTSSSNLTDAQVAIDATAPGLDLTNPTFFGFVYANPSNPSSPVAELPPCPTPSTSSETCPSPGATIAGGSPGLPQEMTVYSSPSPATGFAFPDGGTTGYDSTRVEGAVTGNDTAYTASITLNDPRYEISGNDNQISIGTFSDNVDPASPPTVTATSGGVTTTVPPCPQAAGTTCVQGGINVNPNGLGTGDATCYSVQTNLDQAQALTQYSLNVEENETTSGCPSGDPGVRIQAASQAPPSQPTACLSGTDCAVTLSDPTLGNVTFSVGPDQVSDFQTIQTVQYVLQYAPSPAPGPQATVSGTVTDPSGSVFPSSFEALVVACPTGETPVGGCPGGTIAAADPTSGFYSLNVAPGSYNVLGLVLAPPNSTPGVSSVTLNLNAGDTVTQDFTVPYPPDVFGTVTDSAGNAFQSPIAGVVVACPTGEALVGGCPGGTIVGADPSGSYSMSLAPGSYSVVAVAIVPGYPTPFASAVVTLTVSEYSTTVTQDFTVPYPPNVSGTVTDPAGNGFPSPIESGVIACPTADGFLSATCPGVVIAGAGPGGSYSMTLSPGSYYMVGFATTPNNSSGGGADLTVLTVTAGEMVTQNFVVADPTTLTYTGATEGAAGIPAMVSATLADDVSGAPIADESVSFELGSAGCSATTNASGSAACTLVPTGPIGTSALTASFAGDKTGPGGEDSQYFASNSSTPFAVLPLITVTTYGTQAAGSSSPTFAFTSTAPSGVTISGTLVCGTVDSGTPINGSLAAGSHTIDGASCSGLSAANYFLSYVGASSGFVVASGQPDVVKAGTTTGSTTVNSGGVLFLIGGTINGNVTVSSGGTLIALGGTINGNVTSQGGSISIENTTVTGNISDPGGNFAEFGATVDGNVQLTEASSVAISGGSIKGNLQVQGITGVPPQPVSVASPRQNSICSITVAGNVTIQDNLKTAPFEIGGGRDCSAGLSISGNLQVESNAGPVTIGGAPNPKNNTYSNVVQGNIQVSSNTGGGTLTDNSAGGNIQLSSDTPGIVGSGNVAKGNNTGNRTA